MKPTIYLRIAAVLTLIHAAMHTIGGVFGKPAPGAASIAAAAMQANRFAFMGATRSFWEFHRGLGLAVTIFLTIEAIVFWQLGALAKRDAAALRPILATFTLGYMAFAVDSLVYFFSLAAVMEVMIALCLALAFVTARSSTRAAG